MIAATVAVMTLILTKKKKILVLISIDLDNSYIRNTFDFIKIRDKNKKPRVLSIKPNSKL